VLDCRHVAARADFAFGSRGERIGKPLPDIAQQGEAALMPSARRAPVASPSEACRSAISSQVAAACTGAGPSDRPTARAPSANTYRQMPIILKPSAFFLL